MCQVRTQWCFFFFRHNFNKSLWKTIFLVSLQSHTSPLVCATPPTETSLFTFHPFNGRTMCTVDNFQQLWFGNSQSTNNFKGKPKIVSHPTSSQEILKQQINVYIYIAHRLPIHKVNGTPWYLPRQRKNPYGTVIPATLHVWLI